MENNLNEKVFELHAELCKTLSNPTRLKILNLLREGEKSVNELAESIGARQANVSQQLAVLRQNGIVTTRKHGAHVYYNVANLKIIQACDIIREVLFEQLQKTQELVKQHPKKR